MHSPEVDLWIVNPMHTVDTLDYHSDIIIFAGVPIHHNPELLRQIKPHLPTDKKVFIGTICA